MDESRKLTLGELLKVRTVHGREGKPIARLPDGRVVLFDQNSEYAEMLAPSQSVEGHVIVISENYVIIAPSKEPEEIEPVSYVHHQELEMDDIVEELETLIESMSGNAKVIPKALLRIIQLNQLLVRILNNEA